MVTLREGLMLEDGGVISLVGAGGKTSLMFRLAHELARAGEAVLTTTTTKIYEPRPEQSQHLIVSGSLPGLLEAARAALKNHHHCTAAAAKIADQRKLRGYPPDFIQAIWNSHVFRWIIVEADGAAGRPLKAPADHEPVIPDCTSRVVGIVGLKGAGRPLMDRWVFRKEQFCQITGLASGAKISEDAIIASLVHVNGIFRNAPAGAVRIVFCNQADDPQNLALGQCIGRKLTMSMKSGLSRVVIGQTLFDPPILEIYDLNVKSDYETQPKRRR